MISEPLLYIAGLLSTLQEIGIGRRNKARSAGDPWVRQKTELNQTFPMSRF